MKRWVNAKISITPTATNVVGQPHTFTVTLQKDIGDGNGFVAAAGEHVDVTLTDANGAVHTAPTGTCTNAGANTDAAGQCTITFTSPTAGQGDRPRVLDPLGRRLGAVHRRRPTASAPNSADAVKTFVDANIQITPQRRRTASAQTHVFTAHVNVNNGNGLGFQNAPDGTQISFTKDSGPGTFTTAEPVHRRGRHRLAARSAQLGHDRRDHRHARTTTLSVGGLSLTRDTRTASAPTPARR